MNLRYSLLALAFLPIGLSMAQTNSATSTRPMSATSSTTRTASTTVSSSSANRQQELYDQYHGITKKPATAAPVTTPAPTRSETTQRQATEPVRSQPMVSNRPKPMDATGGSISGTRIGLRGGVTDQFYTKTQTGVDPSIGFVGGLTFNFGGGTFSFQPEVNYARYSQKVTGFSTTAISQALDVLEVPLFLKISSGTYAGNRFFVNIGPYGAYALSASIDGKKFDISNEKGRFGFGAAAGVGTALKAGPGHVTIEVRGLYPLGDIDNGFSTDANTILGQATIGYIFPLGGR